MYRLRPCVFACALIAPLTFSEGMADSLPDETSECQLPGNVLIESSNSSDTLHACLGTGSATRFLSSHGLALPAVRIKLVDAMPDDIPESALGAYSPSRQEIFVLALSVLQERGKEYELFKVPIDEHVYRALIAHEVAHAIAFHNFKGAPTLLAQEYIAFVTFYTTLEITRREHILRQYEYDEDWVQYPAILYLTDHFAFGVHAYRHFQRSENGQRFFRRLLDGEALGIDQ